jgi:hypothetical protein
MIMSRSISTNDSASARKQANRVNARLSTGPKTIRGKQRASKNALRHGLSIPVAAIAGLKGEIEDLALRIVGGKADDARLDIAREIAAAEIDVKRIRETRKIILEDRRRRLPKLHWAHELRIQMHIFSGKRSRPECRAYRASRGGYLPGMRVPDLASNLHRLVKELERCDRWWGVRFRPPPRPFACSI